MNRRDAVLGLVALGAAPLASRAQQQDKVWRVGFLALRRVAILDSDYYYGPFRRGMRELGYVEGKNLVIEWRSADGSPERLAGLAAQLVQLKVDAIVTAGTQAASAAQNATSTIPIVSVGVSDPVGRGFVKSLARPGGNITGLSNVNSDISAKHLEMLLIVVPKLTQVVVLVNPTNPSHARALENIQDAAHRASVKVLPVEARTSQEIESAFSKMTEKNAGAVIVAADAFLYQQGRQTAELAVEKGLPSITSNRDYVEVGGLLSYGQNLAEYYGRAATYVDKIFKGVKPSELPMERPTKIYMAINRKTAKALGLTIPQELLFRADEVIQ